MEPTGLLFSILTNCRTELCRSFPSLNLAFAWMAPCYTQEMVFGTDGKHLYFSEKVIEMYAASPRQVCRGYLHTLLHCLFLHIAPPANADMAAWSLSCDILVERAISQTSVPCMQISSPMRERVLSLLPEGDITAVEMAALLETLPCSREELTAAFSFDDHKLWWEGIDQHSIQIWQSLQSSGEGTDSGHRGAATDSIWEEFALLRPDPRDYRPLLRKYMVPGEENELDDDSFDYIYYHIGMEQLGSRPLLEPLEYKEVRRLDTLAIAIDTSSSCDEETVRRFLQDTFSIFSAEETFFHRMHVVFFQCDCCLQDMVIVHSREEWLAYARNIRIHGRGGTDFRPVFQKIEALRRLKQLEKPRALLYFTDGDGALPSEPPDYETVFILAGKTIHPELLPRWSLIREVL